MYIYEKIPEKRSVEKTTSKNNRTSNSKAQISPTSLFTNTKENMKTISKQK